MFAPTHSRLPCYVNLYRIHAEVESTAVAHPHTALSVPQSVLGKNDTPHADALNNDGRSAHRLLEQPPRDHISRVVCLYIVRESINR